MNIDREVIEATIKRLSYSLLDTEVLEQALHRDDVETHFANGGEVEWTPKGCDNSWSRKVNYVDFNWENCEYRINEKKTLAERRDYLIENLGDLVYPNPLELENLAFLKDLDL